VASRLEEILPSGAALSYAGRAPSAATATGNAGVHKRELAALIEEALGG
jgi:2-oxoglutarate dehydrogenase complex dehydrogenase (E1) component-like enzyme